TVRDLHTLSRYYQDVIGLRLLADEDGETGRRHLLGCGDRVLLELRHDPGAAPRAAPRPGCSTPPSCCPRARRWRTGWCTRWRWGWRWTGPRTIWSARRCI